MRGSAEDTFNGLLDAEADRLCRARGYEWADARRDCRAGKSERSPETKAGKVTLQVPMLRSLPFDTAIIERHKRRGSSAEEALVQMYLTGVSIRDVEDITEVLWGTRMPVQRRTHRS